MQRCLQIGRPGQDPDVLEREQQHGRRGERGPTEADQHLDGQKTTRDTDGNRQGCLLTQFSNVGTYEKLRQQLAEDVRSLKIVCWMLGRVRADRVVRDKRVGAWNCQRVVRGSIGQIRRG